MGKRYTIAQVGHVSRVVTLVGGFVRLPRHDFLPEIRSPFAQHGLPLQLDLQLAMKLLFWFPVGSTSAFLHQLVPRDIDVGPVVRAVASFVDGHTSPRMCAI